MGTNLTTSKSLSLEQFKNYIQEGNLIVDARPSEAFIEQHIPGAVHIPYSTDQSPYLQHITSTSDAILLICPKNIETSIIATFEKNNRTILGYLEGGMETWKTSPEAQDLIIEVMLDEVEMDIRFDDKIMFIDLRKEEDYEQEHLNDAQNIPLDEFNDVLNIALLDSEKNIYLYGYTSSDAAIAASLIKKQGVHNIRIIEGGYERMRLSDLLTHSSNTKK